MPVDHRRRLLFIHIPKTGGTSILTLLGLWKKERSPSLETLFGDFGPADLQHLTLAQTEQFLTPQEFTLCFKFAFVRNPWDRAVSAAFWRTRFKEEGVRDLRDYIDWAERVNRASAPLNRSTVHALPQSAFLTAADGRTTVDRIGRFENFEQDAKEILARFVNIPPALPHKLQCIERREYRDHYTGDLADRTALLYAEDIGRFAYSF